MWSDRQSNLASSMDEDPLGPVATMTRPATGSFGAREAALAGANNHHDPATMFTWHITCSSVLTYTDQGERGD